MEPNTQEYFDKLESKLKIVTVCIFIGWLIIFSIFSYFLLIELGYIYIGGDGFGGLVLIPYVILFSLVYICTLTLLPFQIYYISILKKSPLAKKLTSHKIVLWMYLFTAVIILSTYVYSNVKEKIRIEKSHEYVKLMTSEYSVGYNEFLSSKEYMEEYSNLINELEKNQKIVSIWQIADRVNVITDNNIQLVSKSGDISNEYNNSVVGMCKDNKCIGKIVIISPPTKEEFFKYMRDAYNRGGGAVWSDEGGGKRAKYLYFPVKMYIEGSLLDYSFL